MLLYISLYMYICPQIVVMLKIKKGNFENEKVNCLIFRNKQMKISNLKENL